MFSTQFLKNISSKFEPQGLKTPVCASYLHVCLTFSQANLQKALILTTWCVYGIIVLLTDFQLVIHYMQVSSDGDCRLHSNTIGCYNRV